ncbi:MAG: aspartate dehydrogenase [Candidatus Nitrosotenuis sp.]|uniref:aspartate dehydrogenase n=1 Tax=Candidatus Nitrosotenuis cloacae TaxID=1603555 RepID=UPI00227FA8BA|nr:aspartate dehydrogenase [Candidatus Nitrosotenuis cloacae]MDC8437544.1 aspartate dehydrogenase [Candidatus Nitrosotenuis sp.]
MKRVGILGCGAIGTQIALAIDSGKIPAELTHIYDFDRAKSEALASRLKKRPEIVENPHMLSSNPVDIVVEAASQDAVKNHALSILQNRRDLMIMSVGALLDESVFEILYEACKEFKKKIYLPSGAIAGLDALKSVKDELYSVTITTTKNPKSLKGAKYFETSKILADDINEKTILFDGIAKDAVRLFPANINVAALLSLAGLGSEKTAVRIVADPNTDKNTHQIDIQGKFGKISVTVENVPDPTNPKTSRLAILSAIECLKNACTDDIKIGT